MTHPTHSTTPAATALRPTVGLDLGDRKTHFCALDPEGETEQGTLPTTAKGVTEFLTGREPGLVVMETSTHSPWLSRLVRDLGHEPLVCDARRLELISKCTRKNDRKDAEMLARLARADRTLLNEVSHREEGAQLDLAVLRSRSALVGARTKLVNHVRGVVKSVGMRIVRCDADYFHRRAPKYIPEELEAALLPVMDVITGLSEQIRKYDKKIAKLCEESYPESKVLRQIPGVGPVVSLNFMLTIGDAARFAKSRDAGPYLGLVPRSSKSCTIDPQLRITKTGDRETRRLLVIAANYILGRGPDCDLRRWGLAQAERGGKNAKKRAKVAVARKLAVLLHRLWVTGAEYEPFRQAKLRGEEIPEEEAAA